MMPSHQERLYTKSAFATVSADTAELKLLDVW